MTKLPKSTIRIPSLTSISSPVLLSLSKLHPKSFYKVSSRDFSNTLLFLLSSTPISPSQDLLVFLDLSGTPENTLINIHPYIEKGFTEATQESLRNQLCNKVLNTLSGLIDYGTLELSIDSSKITSIFTTQNLSQKRLGF